MTTEREHDDDRDAWRLISVLFSSKPLAPPVAARLARAAFDLYASDGGVQRLQGGLCEGEVRNLRRELLLGTLPGHAFEAEVETEIGKIEVRYLPTQHGIEDYAARRPRTHLN